MKKYIGFFIGAAMIMTMGCKDMGQVIQGRVIAYDKDKGQVTFLEDKSIIKGMPDYSIIPPAVYTIPEDSHEMGPAPSAGQRMGLDTDMNTIRIFDQGANLIKDIIYTPIDKKDYIDSDNALVADVAFPVVDRRAKTIQIYSKRQKRLVTFTLPDEYFALPDETWAAGDEIRIYYKEKGKALRMMNITQTDIFKK
ncbi:MAG: DUF4881 domain-containing protein [Proteobacteria bacterium]|nr:DUF4881 domain-containing protein [Pseudomonadota bacterium]